jgi:protein TonB
MKKLFVLSLLTLLSIAPTHAQESQETVVASMISPEFIGGAEAMNVFIKENIDYPKEAIEKGLSGTIYVEFIVEKDGKVTAAKVVRGSDPILEKEAVRMVSTMPNWKPGEDRDGNIVRSAMTLPIRFVLDEK